MRQSIHGAMLALIVVVGPPADAASLIVNGSFETASSDPGPNCVELFAGDTSITGWEVTGEAIHYCSPAYWPASDGVRSIDLDGDTNRYGGIRQSLATTPGQLYTVTFAMGGNYVGFPLIKPMQVSADGQNGVFYLDTTGLGGPGWSTMTFSFVADDGNATLEFLSLTPSSGSVPGWGALIDDVVVTPEPGILALLLTGLVGVAALRRSPR